VASEGDQLYQAKTRKAKKKGGGGGKEISWYWLYRTFGISEVQQAAKERIKKSTRNTGSQKLERNIQAPSLGVLNTQRGKYKPKEASDRMINKTLSPEQTLIQWGLTSRLICATLNTNLNCS